jgi:aspartyl-tRNA(Asn)/glutamyl-tRNA(Gln) amidotransferase subunit A
VPDYAAALDEGDLNGLRIGVPKRFFFDADIVRAEVREAVMAAAGVFRELGAVVEEVAFPEIDRYIEGGAFLAEAAAYHEERLRTRPEGFSEGVLARMLSGLELPATEYARTRRKQAEFKQALRQVFEGVELLLTPTAPMAAMMLDQAADVPAGLILRNTGPFSVSGSPAISVPCGFTEGGLPIGLSLAGRDWEEATLLRSAHAYQRATDWHTRRPAGI